MKTSNVDCSTGLGLLAVLACAILIAPHAASAAVISNVETSTVDDVVIGWALSNDLLQVYGSTVGFTNYVPTGGTTGNSADILRDGVSGPNAGFSYSSSLIEASASAADGWTAEYSFDTSVNTLGYDISSIASISSCLYNLDQQSFDLFVHTVGGAWVEIGDGFAGNATPDGGVRVTVTDDSGAPLATGVDGLRFVSTGSLRGSYRELDVVGTPTPEPATTSLLVGGALALLRRRRRG